MPTLRVAHRRANAPPSRPYAPPSLTLALLCATSLLLLGTCVLPAASKDLGACGRRFCELGTTLDREVGSTTYVDNYADTVTVCKTDLQVGAPADATICPKWGPSNSTKGWDDTLGAEHWHLVRGTLSSGFLFHEILLNACITHKMDSLPRPCFQLMKMVPLTLTTFSYQLGPNKPP